MSDLNNDAYPINQPFDHTKLKYFDWNTVPNIGLHVTHPRLDGLKRTMASVIRACLLDERYVNDFYHHIPEWLQQWKLLSNQDEQIDSILEAGFVALSPCEHANQYPVDSNCYRMVLDDEQDYYALLSKDKGKESLAHWAWFHFCQDAVSLTWELVRLIFPHKQFMIAWTWKHTFVMEMGDLETLYDISYQLLNVPFEVFRNCDSVVLYRDPLSYLSSGNACGTDELITFYKCVQS